MSGASYEVSLLADVAIGTVLQELCVTSGSTHSANFCGTVRTALQLLS